VTFPYGRLLPAVEPGSGPCLAHGPEFAVGSRAFAPGQEFALHHHERHEELFVGIRGCVTVFVDGTSHALGVGEKLIVRRGSLHRLVNNGAETAEVAFVKVPFVPDDTVWD